MTQIDKIWRRIVPFKTFVKGWGNPELILRIIESHRIVTHKETCQQLVKSIHVNETKNEESSTSITIEGNFISPLHESYPDYLDEKNRVARFQLLIPKPWNKRYQPLVIHFAGTGDQDFWRRAKFLGKPLLQDGIASLIHMNPYYGDRKPNDQSKSQLNYLSDLFLMGGALILEAQALVRWAKEKNFYPIGIHGISMGGHMSNLAASVSPEPLCLIPCLSWTSVSSVFIRGVFNMAINWDLMAEQYHNNEKFSQTIRNAIRPSIFRPELQNDHYHNSSVRNEGHKLFQSKSYAVSGSEYNISSDIIESENPMLIRPQNNKKNFKLTNRLFELRSSLLNKAMEITNSFYKRENMNEYLKQIHQEESKINQIMLNNDISKYHLSDKVDLETVEFMEDLLDFFTHLGNYPTPTDPRLVSFVVAERDSFFPMDNVPHIKEIWGDECQVKTIKGIGHVEAYFRNAAFEQDFRNAIVSTFNRYIEIYENEEGPFGVKLRSKA